MQRYNEDLNDLNDSEYNMKMIEDKQSKQSSEVILQSWGTTQNKIDEQQIIEIADTSNFS